MPIDVLIITDGRRDCFSRTLASARENLQGDIGQWFVYCDTEDVEFRRWLLSTHHRWPCLPFWHPDGRQGFGGAIAYAWQTMLNGGPDGCVREAPPATHLFHLEDDFTFNRPVPLDDMAQVLDNLPEITQMALRRQPWNADERRAGGVVELRPDEFVDSAGYVHRPGGGIKLHWLEHRLFWTTNPALIRIDHIRRHPWPNVERSEGVYTRQLLDADPAYRFGYWGARDSGEWVHHIGDQRVGTGY